MLKGNLNQKISLTSYSTMRLLARSALFPAKAITIFGLACRWSSFTHVFARANVSFQKRQTTEHQKCRQKKNVFLNYYQAIFQKLLKLANFHGTKGDLLDSKEDITTSAFHFLEWPNTSRKP